MTADVLVVEDSPTQAEQLRRDLEAAGYRVMVETNGVAGYERIRRDRPDAVLTDVVMPEMDGYELCRAVKADAGLRHIPIVLLTSLADPGELLRALEAGADNFLRKPYDPDQLRARLADVLSLRDQSRAPDERLEAEVQRVGRKVTVAFEKRQLLDLMFSSFEELVAINTELRAREEKLRATQAELRSLLSVTESERRRLRAVIGAIPEAMLVIEGDGIVSHATDAVAALLDRDLTTVVGTSVADVLPLVELHDKEAEPVPPQRHPVMQVLAGRPVAETGHTYGTWLPGPSGLRPVTVRAAGVPDPAGNTSVVAIIQDLSGLALRDRTTGLAGPDLFADRVNSTVAATGAREHTAVLLIGLDRFEPLREALPNEARAVLAVTARRIEEAIVARASGAIAAYLGRDEFGILLPRPITPLSAETFAHRLRQKLRQPVAVGTTTFSSTVSVGLALAGQGGEANGVALLQAAGTALHRARRRGGDCLELPDESLRNQTLARLHLESELREAIVAQKLTLVYKPQIRLATHEVVAVEAIVSWPHPTRGTLDLNDFLALADETGLIVDISRWALAEACRTVGRWRRLLPGAAAIQLAMTASTRWIRAPGFPAEVEAALGEQGLPPETLTIGLAEGTSPDEEVTVRESARALRQLGIEVAVIDFGRRSSLKSPRHLGAQRLVLEPALVAAMTHDVADAALVGGVIRLAHGLGLQTLATGVADDEQVLSLRLMGCDFAQGPALARRRPADEFERWWTAPATTPQPVAGDNDRSLLLTGGHGRPGTPEPQTHDAAAEDLRDEVLTYLAHELRNPLGVLAAAAQLLDADRDRMDPALHDLVASLGQATSHLAKIIDRLYDVRAAHLGVLRVDRSDCDLATELRRVMNDTSGLAEREVRSRIPASCSVAVDRHRLRQVFVNLIGNAVKYTIPGTVIEVDLETDDRWVRVSVRDQGPGIPPDRRHELFHKFARLGNSLPGTGLGLFLSRAIARAHGGDLVYEQPEGPGARFALLLPRKD